MYRRILLLVSLTLSLAGCYTDSGYYSETRVTALPTTYGSSVYAYDDGYTPYYQERRIYVAPQQRYYAEPQVRYYSPPPVRYYAPPPLPRYYQPGRGPGYGWGDNRYRGNNDPRHDFRGNPGRGGPSWGDGHGGGRGHDGRGGGRGNGRGGHGGGGRGGGHR